MPPSIVLSTVPPEHCICPLSPSEHCICPVPPRALHLSTVIPPLMALVHHLWGCPQVPPFGQQLFSGHCEQHVQGGWTLPLNRRDRGHHADLASPATALVRGESALSFLWMERRSCFCSWPLRSGVWRTLGAWVCDGICPCSVAAWQSVAVMETTLHSLTGVPLWPLQSHWCPRCGPSASVLLSGPSGRDYSRVRAALCCHRCLWPVALGWMWPGRGVCRLQFLGASWCCVPGRVAQRRLGRAWGTQPGRGVHVVPLQGFVSWGACRE